MRLWYASATVLRRAACDRLLQAKTKPRCAGYFRGSAQGRWSGLQGITVGCEPQHGPTVAHPDLGVCTVGSCPLIVNYNILVQGMSMPAGAP